MTSAGVEGAPRVGAEAISEIGASLVRRLEADADFGYARRLAALGALSDALLARGSALPGVPPGSGLAFLAGFLRPSSLEHLVARELPAPAALERFVAIDGRKSVRLLPRGLVCHWVAGNVPLLGMFSWALSALVGNVNLLRLSSRQDDLVTPILDVLAAVSPDGERLAAGTAVVRFDREDEAAHRAMSELADVRLAWGGREAVDAVRSLPARWEADTIVLGPRVSYAIVDPASASDGAISRLATDIVVFDQQACSSPQCVFVKGAPGEPAFDGFVERFTRAFATQADRFARHPLDWGETYRIHLDRARVLLGGGSLARDEATSWTVALVGAPRDELSCANRFVQVVPFARADEVVGYLPANVQTVVTLLDPGDAETFTEAAARRGVCRFPRPGEGNHFETPWDGVPLVARLVRWVVRTEAGAQRA